MLELLAFYYTQQSNFVKFEALETLVNSLAYEGGIKVEVDPRLKMQRVLLQKANSSPLDCLKALASSLDASLVKEGSDSFRLMRSESDDEKFYRLRTDDRSIWLKRAVSGLEMFRSVKGTSCLSVTHQLASDQGAYSLRNADRMEEQPAFYSSHLLPANIYLLAAIKKIGYDAIASVKPGENKVWEDHPAFGAERIPAHVAVDSVYSSAKQLLAPISLTRTELHTIKSLGMGKAFEDWNDDFTPPAEIRLVVRSEDAMFRLFLDGYDASGHRKFFASLFVYPTLGFRSPDRIGLSADKAKLLGSVKLSSNALANIRVGTETKVRLANLPPWFVDPVSYEPLNAFVAEALVSVFGAQPECFAVAANDVLWYDVKASIRGDFLDLDALKAILSEWSGYKLEKDSNSTVLKSRWHRSEPSEFESRKALRKLVQQVDKSGQLLLRDEGVFWNSVSKDTPVERYWISVIRKLDFVSSFKGDTWPSVYSLIGKTSDESWRQLLTGREFSVDQLGVTDRLSDILAEDYAYVARGIAIGTKWEHAPELFPEGINLDSLVQVKSIDVRVVQISTPTGSAPPDLIPLDASTTIGTILVKFHKYGQPTVITTRQDWEKELGQAGTFRLGRTKQLEVQLLLPMDQLISYRFVEPAEFNSAQVSFNQLPIEVKDFLWTQTLEAALHPKKFDR